MAIIPSKVLCSSRYRDSDFKTTYNLRRYKDIDIYKELTKETSVGLFASLMKKKSKADNCDNSEDERQQSLSTV